MNRTKNLAIWNDTDLLKFAIIAFAFGMLVGTGVGYEWAWKPVVNCFKPLVG